MASCHGGIIKTNVADIFIMKPQILRCPHCPPCPGCPLIHLPADEILTIKQGRVREAFNLFPGLQAAEIKPCLPALSQTGYRTRVKFAVGAPRKGKVSIGLFLQGTHEVIDLPQCLVINSGLLSILDTLRFFIPTFKAPVVHLDLRWSLYQERAHVTLVAASGCDIKALSLLAEALMQKHPEVSGISLREAAPGPVTRALSGTGKLLLGEKHLIEKLGPWSFRLSPGSFFQADPAGALKLHEIVREWLGGEQEAKRLVDLFAGVGAFAVTLAGSAQQIAAVESVREAAEDAQASAALSGVNIQVLSEPAEKSIKILQSMHPDLVVIDPPRRGVDSSVLRVIGQVCPVRLAYVSCDPETLARDLSMLSCYGLVTKAVLLVDLFALTDQVEAVALVESGAEKWKPPILYRDENSIVVDKPAILTTEAIKKTLGLKDFQSPHEPENALSGAVIFNQSGANQPDAFHDAGASAAGHGKQEYLALVKGIPHKKGNLPLLRSKKNRQKDRKNRYGLVDVIGGYGLIKIYAAAGLHNQILRQLSLMRHPALGDTRYGDKRANRFLAETCALSRPFLHLSRISFTPEGAGAVTVDSELPGDLQLVIKRLQKMRTAASPENKCLLD